MSSAVLKGTRWSSARAFQAPPRTAFASCLSFITKVKHKVPAVITPQQGAPCHLHAGRAAEPRVPADFFPVQCTDKTQIAWQKGNLDIEGIGQQQIKLPRVHAQADLAWVAQERLPSS